MTSGVKPEVIGLIPAGGHATRMGTLPCSKEIFPLDFPSPSGASSEYHVSGRVACSGLLDSLQLAGVGRAYVVLRNGKWDIPAYLGNGEVFGVSLAYLIGHHPYGVPFTLDSAYPFIQDSVVALGFPDIVFEPASAMETVLRHLGSSSAEVVLGLFPCTRAAHVDMVETDASGRVIGIEIKCAASKLRQAWVLAAWTPRFSRYLHEFVCHALAKGEPMSEIHLGHVFQAALRQHWDIRSILFADGWFQDIGAGVGE